MANIAAAASGDFSAPATWVGGVVPGSGDVAFSNTFTVTISDTRQVQAISNATGTGITAGGTFSALNGCNLKCTNANGIVQGAPSATVPSTFTTPSLGAGSSAILEASFTMSQPNNGSAVPTVSHASSGTLTIVGNITNTGGAQFATIGVSGNAILTLNGNLTGGATNSASALSVGGSANVSITGIITGGNNSSAFGIGQSGGTVTVTAGTVLGGSAGPGISCGGGTLTVNGTCQSSTTQPAIGPGNTAQITRLSGPFLLGAAGNINPVQAVTWRWAPTLVPTYMEVATSGGSTRRNLYTADNMPSGGYPTAGHVRQSTIYGPSGELTGTLAVPSPSSVALGVATDNTTGTAVLTAANVRSAMGLASANLDTQLANKATVDQVASIVQGATSA